MKTNKSIITNEIGKVKNLMITHIKDEISSLKTEELEMINDYFVELDKNRTIISFNQEGIEVYNSKKQKEVRTYLYENLNVVELTTIVDFLHYKNEIITEDVA